MVALLSVIISIGAGELLAARRRVELPQAAATTAERKELAGHDDLVAVTIDGITRRAGELFPWILVDFTLTATSLDVPVKALKGTLRLSDGTGKERLAVDCIVTTVLRPKGRCQLSGYRLVYDQFDAGQRWLGEASPATVQARFVVSEVVTNADQVKRYGGSPE